MGEVENTDHLTLLDTILCLVYANHLRCKLMETIPIDGVIMDHFNLNAEMLFNALDDMDIIEDYINELHQSFIPVNIKDMYILKLCCPQWRENNLRTTERESKVYEMTKSMIALESRFN